MCGIINISNEFGTSFIIIIMEDLWVGGVWYLIIDEIACPSGYCELFFF